MRRNSAIVTHVSNFSFQYQCIAEQIGNKKKGERRKEKVVSQLWDIFASTTKFFPPKIRKPLTHKSGWFPICPYIIRLESNVKVMKIKKMITDLDFKTISPFQLYKKINTNVRVLSKD